MEFNEYQHLQYLYEKDLKKFLSKNLGTNEIDFLNYRIKSIKDKINYLENIDDKEIRDELMILYNRKFYNPIIGKPATKNEIETFLNKETDSYRRNIPERIKKLKEKTFNFTIKIQRIISNKDIEGDDSILNLSDTKGTEKIIMLKKLGVFDFLKTKEPFNLSTNSLASAISGITGIDVTTVQSYINPIDNPNVSQKNNPLKTNKTVSIVDKKLSSIGFNQSE